MIADGMSPSEVTSELPELEEADLTEALLYTAFALREREIPIRLAA